MLYSGTLGSWPTELVDAYIVRASLSAPTVGASLLPPSVPDSLSTDSLIELGTQSEEGPVVAAFPGCGDTA